jgi:MraZ protein
MPSALTSKIFAGEFRHSLDGKNRLTIPARWRKGEADEFFLVPHHEHNCLVAMPPEEFQQVRENARSLPPQKQAAFLRLFASRTSQATADKQGRLLLIEDQCKQAGLKSEVVVVGMVTRFEIWSPVAWAKYQRDEAPSYSEDASAVGL